MNIIDAGLKFKSNLSKRKNTQRIIVHHSAANESVETIHSWHLGRGWVGIGYNFYIRKDGTIYQGRGWEYVGAHCSGYNSTSIGICFEGNYETSDIRMPEAQYNAGVALIAEALKRYPAITEICGHRQYSVTACPGKYFPLAGLIADGKGNKGSVTAGTGTVVAPSYNENVKALQEALNADDIRDANGNKLIVDGLKGTNTSAAIKKVLLKAGAFDNKKYTIGITGEVVRWLQRRLNAELGSDLNEDGKFGNDTRTAVGQWQKAKNLTVDYIAGVDTITSLL